MKKNIIKLTDILKTVSKESCPYKLNFHCHTNYSDGSLRPLELYKQAIKFNLSHIAITDHHSVKAFIDIENEKKNNSLIRNSITKLWSGLEITGLLDGCLVHILALDVDISSSYISPYIKGESVKGDYLKANNIIYNIRQSGGISILAHPARYRVPFNRLIEQAYNIGFDGIEVWYDYERSDEWRPSPFICEKILEQIKNTNLLHTCGTDTHGLLLNKR